MLPAIHLKGETEPSYTLITLLHFSNKSVHLETHALASTLHRYTKHREKQGVPTVEANHIE